jgi:hypothetical protein
MVLIFPFHDVVVEKIRSEHIPESIGSFRVEKVKEIGIEFLRTIPEILEIIHPIIFLTKRNLCKIFSSFSPLSSGRGSR